MNKEEIIEIFEKAKAEGLHPPGRTFLYNPDSDTYCSAGLLCRAAGYSNEQLMFMRSLDFFKDTLCLKLGVSYPFLIALMNNNDLLFFSWDDSIEFVRKW